MMLINGILCLIAAIILFIQISRSRNEESNELFQKFLWMYWSILMIIGIHHVFSGMVDPWINTFISALDPITDTLHAFVGIVLSLYLSKRRSGKASTYQTS